MAAHVVDNVFSLIAGGVLCGQPVENVLHFYPSSAPIGDAISLGNDLCTQWQAGVKPAWLAAHPQNYTYLGVKARRCNTGGGPTVGILEAAGTMGGRPSDASDSAIGPVLIAPYSQGGRWRTAKIFINGAGDADINNNAFEAGLQAALSALSSVFIGPLPGGASAWQYCSFLKPTSVCDLLNVGISGKPGVQNRRLRPTF